MKRIGIVGGGQLGRMLAEAAHRLGFTVIVLDPTPGSPAGQVADAQIVGSWKDAGKILELADASDVITFEIESADSETLEALVRRGKVVRPSPGTLGVIKDKFGQKVFLRNHGIPVADFALIESEDDCREQGKIFGYPFLLKSRFDAYDGRGNFVVQSESDIPAGFAKLGGKSLYAEAFVPFVKELSVVSARGEHGEIVSFPVVETIHKNNICHIVRSPAPVSADTAAQTKALAEKVLASLEGIGVFAVEMFLRSDGAVLVNEIAPRVHNSGHHTIEAFGMSQFEAHIRAIAGLPLTAPEPRSRAAVMINILGERSGEALISGGSSTRGGDAFVHVYGKLETRPERKMGHITVLADSLEEAEQKAIEIRNAIEI